MSKKKKKYNYQEDVLKAIHIASRNDQFDRNGGGQFVAINRPHKNKKKYDRKQIKKEMRNNISFYFLTPFFVT